MSKHYTTNEREQAIEACAMMASSNHQHYTFDSASYFCDAIDTESNAAELARKALWSIPATGCRREQWAEAECMLREGWNP